MAHPPPTFPPPRAVVERSPRAACPTVCVRTFFLPDGNSWISWLGDTGTAAGARPARAAALRKSDLGERIRRVLAQMGVPAAPPPDNPGRLILDVTQPIRELILRSRKQGELTKRIHEVARRLDSRPRN